MRKPVAMHWLLSQLLPAVRRAVFWTLSMIGVDSIDYMSTKRNTQLAIRLGMKFHLATENTRFTSSYTIVGINDGYGLAMVCVFFSAFNCSSIPFLPFRQVMISAKETFTNLAHCKVNQQIYKQLKEQRRSTKDKSFILELYERFLRCTPHSISFGM